MLPGGGGDPPGDPPELGRFKAFLFFDFGPGGRGPSGSNLARKSARVRGSTRVSPRGFPRCSTRGPFWPNSSQRTPLASLQSPSRLPGTPQNASQTLPKIGIRVIWGRGIRICGQIGWCPKNVFAFVCFYWGLLSSATEK